MGAAFPRLAYWPFWPPRLGPRGLLAYIAVNALFIFWLRQFMLPYLERKWDELEQAREQLRQRLGREPTEDELLGHFGIAGKR